MASVKVAITIEQETARQVDNLVARRVQALLDGPMELRRRQYCRG